jgi:hypothetical protein
VSTARLSKLFIGFSPYLDTCVGRTEAGREGARRETELDGNRLLSWRDQRPRSWRPRRKRLKGGTTMVDLKCMAYEVILARPAQVEVYSSPKSR